MTDPPDDRDQPSARRVALPSVRTVRVVSIGRERPKAVRPAGLPALGAQPSRHSSHVLQYAREPPEQLVIQDLAADRRETGRLLSAAKRQLRRARNSHPPPLVAAGANSESTPGPVFDEASSGTAKGDAEYRRWRPGRRIAKNGPPVRVARKQKGLIRRMMNAEPRNSARPTAYRSLAREHSGLLGTYVCTHRGGRNTSTSRHQQGVGPLFTPAATSAEASAHA